MQRLGKKDCDAQATNVSLAEDMQRIHPCIWRSTEGELNATFLVGGKVKRS
ncbi:hypothetical protein D3C75_1295130 [compost metagenome]